MYSNFDDNLCVKLFELLKHIVQKFKDYFGSLIFIFMPNFYCIIIHFPREIALSLYRAGIISTLYYHFNSFFHYLPPHFRIFLPSR